MCLRRIAGRSGLADHRSWHFVEIVGSIESLKAHLVLSLELEPGSKGFEDKLLEKLSQPVGYKANDTELEVLAVVVFADSDNRRNIASGVVIGLDSPADCNFVDVGLGLDLGRDIAEGIDSLVVAVADVLQVHYCGQARNVERNGPTVPVKRSCIHWQLDFECLLSSSVCDP